MADLYSGPSVCRVAQVSYRQLDYWCRIGLVTPTKHADGSGSRRGYSGDEVVELAVVGRLCRVFGQSGPRLYGQLGPHGDRIVRDGVVVQVDRDAIRAGVAEGLARVRPRPAEDTDPRVTAGRAVLPPQLASLR